MNGNNPENYGKKLKTIRRERKLTQSEVAKLCGISRSYYSDIERSNALPSGKVMFKINKVLPLFHFMVK